MRKARELLAFLAVHPGRRQRGSDQRGPVARSRPRPRRRAAQPRAAQGPGDAPHRGRPARADVDPQRLRPLPPRPRPDRHRPGGVRRGAGRSPQRQRRRPAGRLPPRGRAVPRRAGRGHRLRVGRAVRRDRPAPRAGRLDHHRGDPPAGRPRPGAVRPGDGPFPRPLQRVPVRADHAAAGRSGPPRGRPPDAGPAGIETHRPRHHARLPRPGRPPPPCSPPPDPGQAMREGERRAPAPQRGDVPVREAGTAGPGSGAGAPAAARRPLRWPARLRTGAARHGQGPPRPRRPRPAAPGRPRALSRPAGRLRPRVRPRSQPPVPGRPGWREASSQLEVPSCEGESRKLSDPAGQSAGSPRKGEPR